MGFIAGLMIGGLLGIVLMAIVAINAADDDTTAPGNFGKDDDTGANL